MKPLVLCASGFSSECPDKLAASIRAEGYDFVGIPIAWEGTFPDDWKRQYVKEYLKHQDREVIFAGFSLGALTAFRVAAEYPPSELWLFSLSGRFAEDVPQMAEASRAYLERATPGLVGALEKLSFEQYVGRIHCPTLLFIGDKEAKENPEMNLRVLDASQRIQSASPIIRIGKVGHNVTDPRYLTAIRQAIRRNV